MPLTAIDVQQKTFMKVMRGYDLDEVDDFLDEVVTSLSDYEKRLHDAQQRIAILDTQALGQGEGEAAISRALIAAQRSADQIIAEAKIEAEQVLATARSDAKALAGERDRERSTINAEIGEMRRVIADLRAKLAELAESSSENIDLMEEAVESTAQLLDQTAVEEAEAPVVGGYDEIEESTPVAPAPESGEQPGEEEEEEPPLQSLGWEVVRDEAEDGEHPRAPRPWEEV